MIITKKVLNRRTFLRGAGAALALPLLDSMLPAMTPAVKTAAMPVRRLGYLYIPMGAHMPKWTPVGVGPMTTLSPTLSSLTPYLQHLTVLSKRPAPRHHAPEAL